MTLLDGKVTSQKILDSLRYKISGYIDKGSRIPRLDIILVGSDFGSQKYVEMKKKKALELGIKTVIHEYDEKTNTQEILSRISELNKDSRVDGLMVQLPLPKGFDTNEILENIDPKKDVDGLTSSNLGKLFKNDPTALSPATAKGVISLLGEYKIDLDGKRAVVIGRSDIVGLPTAGLLQNANCTVTICHSHTKNLKEISKDADILVVGIGKAEYIDKSYIKEGAVVIDIGTNKSLEGKLVGDVKFSSAQKVSSFLTPVPGGVGPMTIASLLTNLFEIYERNVKKY